MTPPGGEDAERTMRFLYALRSAKPAGSESPFWPHFGSTYAKWYKRFRKLAGRPLNPY